MIEMTITVKGEEGTYKQKFLVYEEIEFNSSKDVLKKYIDETIANTKIKPEKVCVKASLYIT